MGFTDWINGRRTYAIAAGSRLAIAYLWSNGVIGHEAAAAGFTAALGGSALRAGISGDLTRFARAFRRTAPLLLIGGLAIAVVGCATFGGGTDEAKAAEKAAALGLGAFIPPPFNLLVPAATVARPYSCGAPAILMPMS